MSPETPRQDRLDQLRLLVDSVETFTARAMPLQRTRRLRGHVPEFEATTYSQLAAQGWLGLLVPEHCGGFGLGFHEAAAITETLAGALAPEPFVPVAVTASGLLTRAERSPARDRYLRDVVEGTEIPAVAWQDVLGTCPSERAPFRATHAPSGWIIEGDARFVRPGTGATAYLLSVESANGSCLVVCRPEASGLKAVAEPLADGTFQARLRARQVLVASDALFPLPVDAVRAVMEESLVMGAAELLGVMTRMRRLTLEYLKTRMQFGKPIGSFQALQHRAVDLLIQEELTRAVIGEAVEALEARGTSDAASHAGALASRAKARASDAARWIARESIQMHGGLGVTDEYDLALYVNRTLSLAPWLGSASSHRLRHQHLNPPLADPEE